MASGFQEGGGAPTARRSVVPDAGSGHFPLTSPLPWEILPHFTNLLKITLLAGFESRFFKKNLPPLKRQYDNQRERKM